MIKNSAIPFIIILAIALSFFSIVLANAVNIPNGDDLFCLLLFTQKFQDAASLSDRLRMLLEQWVEHRIVYSKLTALISYWIHHQVNLVTILLIGNLTLVGYTVLFWKLLKKVGLSLYYLIPVALTLFSPVMYEANLWAGAATVYMPVGFLGLLTMYLLAFSSGDIREYIWPLLTALLATFSFGNGMFAFAAGLVVLIYKKEYRIALIWTAIAIIAVCFYFYNFTPYSSTNAFSVSEHFEKPQYLLLNLLGFIGGSIDNVENINAPFVANNIPGVVLGLVCLIMLGFLTFSFLKKNLISWSAKKNPTEVAWLGMTLFFMLTAVAMAYSRTDGSAMNTLSSRYKIYSMIAVILVYLGCLFYSKKKKQIGLFFGGVSVIFLLCNYYQNYEKMVNYNTDFVAGLYNYTHNGQWIIYRQTNYYEGASKVISDSISSAANPVYQFSPNFPQLTNSLLVNAPVLNQFQMDSTLSSNNRNEKSIWLQSDEYPSFSTPFQGIYLVLYNESSIYLLPAKAQKNSGKKFLTGQGYFKSGFYLDTNLGDVFPAGSVYNLAIFCPTEEEQVRRIPYQIKL